MSIRRSRPDVSILDGAALFDGYSRRQLAPLTSHVDRLAVVPGAGLARAGRHPHQVLVLLAGEAIVRRAGHDIARLGPGAVIGAAEEASAAAHEHDVVAAGAVSALVIEGRAFRWATQALPGFRERLAAHGRPARSRPPARTDAPLDPAA